VWDKVSSKGLNSDGTSSRGVRGYGAGLVSYGRSFVTEGMPGSRTKKGRVVLRLCHGNGCSESVVAWM